MKFHARIFTKTQYSLFHIRIIHILTPDWIDKTHYWAVCDVSFWINSVWFWVNCVWYFILSDATGWEWIKNSLIWVCRLMPWKTLRKDLCVLEKTYICLTTQTFLDTQVSLAPTHVSPLVGWSVSKSHFRISNLWSVTVPQIKKVKKTKSIYFQILLLGGSSPPTKMYMKA